MRRNWMVAVLAVGVMAGACTAPPAENAGAVDTAAEEETIRAISAQWLALTRQGDAAGIAALFAEDGRVLWAGQEPVVGRAAVAEFLTGDFAANPGRESNWQAERVAVAASGDLAVEYGSYTSGGADGVVVEEGNYTTVYRKAAGGWMILSDSSVPNAIPGAATN